jgi:hypothetical protein
MGNGNGVSETTLAHPVHVQEKKHFILCIAGDKIVSLNMINGRALAIQ